MTRLTDAELDAIRAVVSVSDFPHRGNALALLREVDRLREALRLIADQTICPEAFPNEDIDGDRLAAKTALLIALAALDPTSSHPLEAPKC